MVKVTNLICLMVVLILLSGCKSEVDYTVDEYKEKYPDYTDNLVSSVEEPLYEMYIYEVNISNEKKYLYHLIPHTEVAAVLVRCSTDDWGDYLYFETINTNQEYENFLPSFDCDNEIEVFIQKTNTDRNFPAGSLD